MVKKSWVDSQATHKPVKVNVYHTDENGNRVIDCTLELNEDNNWTASKSGLQLESVLDSSFRYYYNAEEVNPPANYTITYQTDYDRDRQLWTCNITNKEKGRPDPTPTPTPPPSDKVTVKIWKSWNDTGDSDYRPSSVVVHLYRYTKESKQQELVTTLRVTKSNSWYAAITGMDYADTEGNRYYYRVTEDPPESQLIHIDYKTTYREQFNEKDRAWEIVVTNTELHDDIPVTVKKVWDNDNNKLGLRPASVTVHLSGTLYSPGDYVDLATIVLSEENNWQWTEWYPQYIQGSQQTVKFRVTEDPVPNYTTTIKGL